MQTKQFTTTSAAFKSVIHNEGILGFYRGYFSTVAREVSYIIQGFKIMSPTGCNTCHWLQTALFVTNAFVMFKPTPSTLDPLHMHPIPII
jgi:hypothetical protein